MSKITLTPEQIQEVIDRLEGTPHFIDAILREVLGNDNITFVDIDTESLMEIEDAIFQCEDCGWWLDISCMSYVEGCCGACYDERLEYEEDMEEEVEDEY